MCVYACVPVYIHIYAYTMYIHSSIIIGPLVEKNDVEVEGNGEGEW